VTNESRELEHGEYFWNQSDGSIQFNESSKTETENVTVETTAVTLPDQAGTFVTVLEPIVRIPAYAYFFIGVGVVILGLKGLTKQTGGRGPV